MCYGCSPTCDNCRPKFVMCPACSRNNFLNRDACAFCGEVITQAMKDDALKAWNDGFRFAAPPTRSASKPATGRS